MVNKGFKITALANIILIIFLIVLFFQKQSTFSVYKKKVRLLVTLKGVIKDKTAQRLLIRAYNRAKVIGRKKSLQTNMDGDIEKLLAFIKASSIKLISFKKRNPVMDGELERHYVLLGLKASYKVFLKLLKLIDGLRTVSSLRILNITADRQMTFLDIKLYLNLYKKGKSK